MKARCILLSVFLLILGAGSAAAETVAGLPLHVQKLEGGAIRVWIGDHISSTATVAIPTAKGLVIIDTTGNPQVDRQLRGIIARELDRDDFNTLINTHGHGDHTGGNGVYADCTIVGHELVAAGMERNPEQEARAREWMTARVAELEQEIAGLPADSPQLPVLREDLTLKRMELAADSDEVAPVPPTKTFADRLVLDFGDRTCELSYIGGMHSPGDIAIFVPELGLLMTGDTMADVWLTETPGCLASFIARQGIPHDFPRLLANWNALLARRDEIKRLVTGHWNGELTLAGFEARVKYVEALWEGLGSAAAAGVPLEQALVDFRLDTRFPDLARSPGCSLGNNSTTILEMWPLVTHQQSAAVALYDLLEAGADEAEIRSLLAQRGAASPTHFFLEGQINGFGYRFLQQEKAPQAVAMFRINVELFPASWNVYDSLAEALLAAGDRDGAIANYEKSLELNPESVSGRTALERIRGGT